VVFEPAVKIYSNYWNIYKPVVWLGPVVCRRVGGMPLGSCLNSSEAEIVVLAQRNITQDWIRLV